jgi:phosphatidate cytidylyltransferase
MLRWRLILGVLIVAVLAVVCWLDAHAARPGIYLAPLALVLALLASHEMLGFYRHLGHQPLTWVIYFGTLVPVVASFGPIAWVTYPADCPIGRLGWLAGGLAAALLMALVGEMKRTDNAGSSIVHLALACLSILYVGGLLGIFVQLRLLSNNPVPDQGDYGLLAWLSLVIVVKFSDIGQYTVGRIFGRHKLAKTLSPGKTWEGALGGILFALIGACFSLGLLAEVLGNPSQRGWQAWLGGCLCYGTLVGIAGIVGDLAESMLKRDAGIKDSSQWLPGFGGILDLLDSLLVAAPVAYFCWITGLVGP